MSPRAAALAHAPPEPRAGAALRRRRLDNGLVVIARENRASRSVTVRFVFEAGSAFDPRGLEGTAELVSDLLDRGAGAQSAQQVAEWFDFLGATFLVQARRDTLEVESRMLSHHLPDVLARLRLLLESPAFPDEEIRREKAQVLTAIAERDQDTASVAEETLSATLYPEGHPYHAPRMGTRDSVRAIRREDLVRFHRDRVGPSGAVMVVAGDVDPDEALDRAATVFGSWPAGGPGERRAMIPDAPPPARAIAVVRPIEGKTQADIVLGFPGMNRRSPQLPAALVMSNALGEFGLGGRLGKAVRDKAGLAYYAYSHVSAGLGAGPVVVRAGVALDKVLQAIGLIRDTLRRTVERGFSPAEISDARQSLAASVPRRLETNPEAAGFLADCEFHGLGLDYPDRLPVLLTSVTKAEAEALARRHLDLAHHVMVVAGPALEESALR